MPRLAEVTEISELLPTKATTQKQTTTRRKSSEPHGTNKRRRTNSSATSAAAGATQQVVVAQQNSRTTVKTLASLLPGTSLLPKVATATLTSPELVTSRSSAVNVLQTLLANNSTSAVSVTSASQTTTQTNSLPVQLLSSQQVLQLLTSQAQKPSAPATPVQPTVQALAQEAATQQLQKLIQQQLLQASIQQQLTQQLQQQLAAAQSRQAATSQQTPILPKPEPSAVSLINLESLQRFAAKPSNSVLKPVTAATSREVAPAAAVSVPIAINHLLQPAATLSRARTQTTNSANLQQALATAQVLNSLGSMPTILPQTAILPIVVSLPNSVTSSAFPTSQLSRVVPKSEN